MKKNIYAHFSGGSYAEMSLSELECPDARYEFMILILLKLEPTDWTRVTLISFDGPADGNNYALNVNWLTNNNKFNVKGHDHISSTATDISSWCLVAISMNTIYEEFHAVCNGACYLSTYTISVNNQVMMIYNDEDWKRTAIPEKFD